MQGFLLDTNILCYLFNGSHEHYPAVSRHLEALDPAAPVFVSAVALGEIEYGHRCVSGEDTELQRRFNRFVEERFPQVLRIRASTRGAYGMLRSRLFERYAPPNRRSKIKRPEELIDPTTAMGLGIEENDLWMAAQAMERNLVFVTADKMRRIRAVLDAGLCVEDWTCP